MELTDASCIDGNDAPTLHHGSREHAPSLTVTAAVLTLPRTAVALRLVGRATVSVVVVWPRAPNSSDAASVRRGHEVVQWSCAETRFRAG